MYGERDTVWVDGHGRIPYTDMVRTSDGYDLYDHHHDFGSHHLEYYCPLLLADTACYDCPHYMKYGNANEPRCSAVIKLENHRHDWNMGLKDIEYMTVNQNPSRHTNRLLGKHPVSLFPPVLGLSLPWEICALER